MLQTSKSGKCGFALSSWVLGTGSWNTFTDHLEFLIIIHESLLELLLLQLMTVLTYIWASLEVWEPQTKASHSILGNFYSYVCPDIYRYTLGVGYLLFYLADIYKDYLSLLYKGIYFINSSEYCCQYQK